MNTVYHVTVDTSGQINKTYDLGMWASESQAEIAVDAARTQLDKCGSVIYVIRTQHYIVNDLCALADEITEMRHDISRTV